MKGRAWGAALKVRAPASPSELVETLVRDLKLDGLPEPFREVRFDEKRRWKFDLAWPIARVAVECEGGIWAGGRHTRGRGYETDCEKYNAATLAGWTVLRFTLGMIRRGEAVPMIRKALEDRR